MEINPGLDIYMQIYCNCNFRCRNVLYFLLILLLCGDVESNPGPHMYICPKCKTKVTGRHCSVQCNRCMEWLHIQCTDLKSYKHYTSRWTCCAPIRPSYYTDNSESYLDNLTTSSCDSNSSSFHDGNTISIDNISGSLSGGVPPLLLDTSTGSIHSPPAAHQSIVDNTIKKENHTNNVPNSLPSKEDTVMSQRGRPLSGRSKMLKLSVGSKPPDSPQPSTSRSSMDDDDTPNPLLMVECCIDDMESEIIGPSRTKKLKKDTQAGKKNPRGKQAKNCVQLDLKCDVGEKLACAWEKQKPPGKMYNEITRDFRNLKKDTQGRKRSINYEDSLLLERLTMHMRRDKLLPKNFPQLTAMVMLEDDKDLFSTSTTAKVSTAVKMTTPGEPVVEDVDSMGEKDNESLKLRLSPTPSNVSQDTRDGEEEVREIEDEEQNTQNYGVTLSPPKLLPYAALPPLFMPDRMSSDHSYSSPVPRSFPFHLKSRLEKRLKCSHIPWTLVPWPSEYEILKPEHYVPPKSLRFLSHLSEKSLDQLMLNKIAESQTENQVASQSKKEDAPMSEKKGNSLISCRQASQINNTINPSSSLTHSSDKKMTIVKPSLSFAHLGKVTKVTTSKPPKPKQVSQLQDLSSLVDDESPLCFPEPLDQEIGFLQGNESPESLDLSSVIPFDPSTSALETNNPADTSSHFTSSEQMVREVSRTTSDSLSSLVKVKRVEGVQAADPLTSPHKVNNSVSSFCRITLSEEEPKKIVQIQNTSDPVRSLKDLHSPGPFINMRKVKVDSLSSTSSTIVSSIQEVRKDNKTSISLCSMEKVPVLKEMNSLSIFVVPSDKVYNKTPESSKSSKSSTFLESNNSPETNKSLQCGKSAESNKSLQLNIYTETHKSTEISKSTEVSKSLQSGHSLESSISLVSNKSPYSKTSQEPSSPVMPFDQVRRIFHITNPPKFLSSISALDQQPQVQCVNSPQQTQIQCINSPSTDNSSLNSIAPIMQQRKVLLIMPEVSLNPVPQVKSNSSTILVGQPSESSSTLPLTDPSNFPQTYFVLRQMKDASGHSLNLTPEQLQRIISS